MAGTAPGASIISEARQRRTVASFAGHHGHEGGPAARIAPRVIILDTDDGRADLLSDIVARRGGHATHVTSGAAALTLIERGRHQCVLVAALSDGSPRAFVAWARRNHPQLTLLAAADDVEQSTDLYVAGADHVVPLPLDADLLAAQIGASLRARGHLTLAA